MIEKLNEKEWKVLKFFIKKESEAIGIYIDSQKNDPSKSFQSFCSYPEAMIKQGLENVSKPKIISACKKLCGEDKEDGGEDREKILKTEKKKAKNNRMTTFYLLKSDIETIKVLIRLINKKTPKEKIEILSYRFFSYHINESFIREILSKKKVSISRHIPLIEWERDEAQYLLNFLLREDFNPDEPYIKFDSLLKEGIDKYEENNKKNEDIYLENLSKLFEQFLVNRKNSSFDSKKYYCSNDYLLFQNMSYQEVISCQEDISEFLDFYLRLPFNVKLPVFSDTVSLDDKIEVILRQNPHLFSNKGANFEGLSKEDLKKKFSGLYVHYSTFEYEKLVLPILALIWCSPSALYEFLCGDWESFEMHFTADGRCEESGFITELLHTVTKDIIANLDIPRNTIVDSVSSKKLPPQRSSQYDSILVSSGPEEYRLRKQFRNTERKYWNSRPYAEIERLLNSSLRIKLKHLWELFIDVGFSVVPGSSESPRIIESVSMDVNYDLLPRLFTVNNIKDAQGLISKLQQRSCPFYCYILNMFSNKVKNVILVYDVREQPSVQLQKMIVEELNSIILDGHFCDESAFISIMYENKNMKDIIEELSSYRYSKKEILNMVDKDTSFESLIISKNRCILETIFEKELEQIYRGLVEG